MKSLVLIASHMRTFSRCLPTQHWHVYRHLPDPTFVVFTVNDRDAQTAYELEKFYPKDRIHIASVESQPELPIPVPPTLPDWNVGRMYSHEPYAISVHPQAVLRQLWQLEKGWEFAKGALKVEEFDVFVRMRPDSWFRDMRMPELHTPRLVGSAPGRDAEIIPALPANHAITPWWGKFGGIQDRFAIMGRKAAEAYFTTYSRIPELVKAGCPLHPESLVKASLEAQGCTVDDSLHAMFSKLYPNDHHDAKLRGTFRDPEITTADLAYYTRK